MPVRFRIPCLASCAAVLSLAGGCLPYTVGSTAQTTPAHQRETTTTWYSIPNAVDILGDSVTAPIFGVDAEWRAGLDDRSDVGIRIPSGSGVVATYKRRLLGDANPKAAALAIMGGAGLVNWGEHAHVELTVMGSGRTARSLTPYGGIRLMQVAPLARGAPHDSPTAGGFFGLRIGSATLGISPEIGVFYDRSALELRKRNFIVVPAISVHGDALASLLGPFGRGRSFPRR